MKTIIAEKPSVAREIARIVGATKREEGYFEGGGYAVTWAFGHLVQLAMPDGYGIRGFVRDNLPVIPDTFTLVPRQVKTEKGYKPDSGVVTQIKTVTRLFKESEQIIVATDAGREGELIFRYLYHYTGCATPFVRLWISSLTDKAIREGLRNLEAGGKYDDLYLAAKARSESDWLVGINGTQALSIAAGHGTYSVGRVQTPTLAMVCARYWENRRFTPEAFWQLHIATDGCDEGTVKFSSSEKWKEKEPATELYNKVKSAGTATVTKAERKEKTEETPLLYDLTTLQKEANTKHGFTAEQTLEIAQKLYEKKLITYPRTGSRYIPEDVFAEIPKLLAFIGALPEWKGKVQPKAVPTRRSVDGSKVTDHHALLVTGEKPLFLSKEDNTVYQMVAGRMIEAFSEKCVKDTATVTAECAGVEFTVKGSVIRQAGWRAVYGEEDKEETAIPGWREGDTLTQAVAYRSNLALGYGNGGQGHRGRRTPSGFEGLRHRHARHPCRHHRNALQARLHGTLQEIACADRKRACPLLCREDDAHRRRRHDGRMGEESGTHRARGAARRHLLQGDRGVHKGDYLRTALVRQAVRPQGFRLQVSQVRNGQYAVLRQGRPLRQRGLRATRVPPEGEPHPFR